MQNRLKVWRTERGLTQLETALKASINVTRLSHIETEKLEPTDEEIAALSRTLDTTPDALFPGLAPQPASQETR